MVFVLYVDMDYFFAACEEVRHPDFKGKPFVVGTAPESERFRGVVQTANYEARKYGIHSGMPSIKAFDLYKDLLYLHSDEEYYESVSAGIMKLLKGYGKPVEVVSVDEAAMDITGLSNEEALEMARDIKKRIKDEFKLTCTIGISSGKAFAKMASDKAKPDGLMLVKADELKRFLYSCALDKLPGVGSKTYERLNEMGISSIQELSKSDPMVLIDAFGSAGKELYMLSNGIDNAKIVESSEVLSIGREVTLKNPATSVDEIKDVLKGLADEVMKEVSKKEVVFKNIGAKVRYTDFTTSGKSYSLHNYSDSEEEVIKHAATMLAALMKTGPARKIGVRVSRLVKTKGQKKLF
ncbi:MAG: DNA polymerase IV [Candidatus Marsarchaeota archaeon]|jgi:nucleotidyltransferase/DNA polymerase involved in DNA repair|nr:DNA polymerase IV [Candidatus Marsarchaeota archaeon]